MGKLLGSRVICVRSVLIPFTNRAWANACIPAWSAPCLRLNPVYEPGMGKLESATVKVLGMKS